MKYLVDDADRGEEQTTEDAHESIYLGNFNTKIEKLI